MKRLHGKGVFGALLLLVSACTSSGDLDLSAMSFSDEPLIGKLVWHDLITDDVDSARRFYGGLFGWTFEETTGPDGTYVLARSGGTYVAGLVPVPPRADGARISRWLPYMSVADVDEAVTKATAGGAKVAAAARNVALGRVAALVDPEGAVLGIARSRVGDPDDTTTASAPGHVVWNELLSRQPQQAARFYQETAGYTVDTVSRRGGEYHFLDRDGVHRAGILQLPAENWDPIWLTYFGVGDPQATVAKAESLGGQVLVAPSQSVREGSMAVITDPAGAVLALQDAATSPDIASATASSADASSADD